MAAWVLARVQGYLLFVLRAAYVTFNRRRQCVCCCCYCLGAWSAQELARKEANERSDSLGNEAEAFRWVALEDPGCCICSCCMQRQQPGDEPLPYCIKRSKRCSPFVNCYCCPQCVGDCQESSVSLDGHMVKHAFESPERRARRASLIGKEEAAEGGVWAARAATTSPGRWQQQQRQQAAELGGP